MKPLRILLLADHMMPEAALVPERFEDVDLIISCGDLPPDYLSFIADISRKDVLYVHGNHDTRYLNEPPLGCICIDDALIEWKGLKILGLGGGHVYNGNAFQYTQWEMKKRYLKLRLKHPFDWRVDILVTHSPAYGLYDGSDPAHTGFQLFNEILERFHPRFFFHGHMHLDYGDYPRIYQYKDCVIINAFTSYLLETPRPKKEERKKVRRKDHAS